MWQPRCARCRRRHALHGSWMQAHSRARSAHPYLAVQTWSGTSCPRGKHTMADPTRSSPRLASRTTTCIAQAPEGGIHHSARPPSATRWPRTTPLPCSSNQHKDPLPVFRIGSSLHSLHGCSLSDAIWSDTISIPKRRAGLGPYLTPHMGSQKRGGEGGEEKKKEKEGEKEKRKRGEKRGGGF